MRLLLDGGGGQTPCVSPTLSHRGNQKGDSIRDTPRQCRGMEKARKPVKTMFAAMTLRGERSTLFWWLVENHDEFKEAARRQRIRWNVVVETATEIGLTNRAGAAPTRKLAKLTWERAQRYVTRNRVVEPVAVSDQTRSVPMPRSPDARPAESDPVDPVASLNQQHQATPAPFQPYARPQSPSRPLDETPSAFFEAEPAEAPPTRTDVAVCQATDVEGDWTPEQIAHLDATLARARAHLDHLDRFLKLQE